MLDFAAFERYRPIIPAWDLFIETLSRPLPTCIWANTLRITPQQLAEQLAEDGLEFEPLPWYPGGFKLAHDFKPGRHWAYLAGLYHVQEAVSMLPVLLLQPEPGQRVLDLCAAPGNKTAQLAVSMANRGTVVANDISYSRMRAVRHTLDRLGLVNTSITTADGANIPKTAGQFDMVLADVPCSGEGMARKDPLVLLRAGPELAYKKQGLQIALLRKAVQRCTPGGRIVYATCTLAPEENEMVVDAVLREYGPELIRLAPARIEGLVSAEGLTSWSGQQFHPSLRQTMRVWPHQNDTGGFFIAVIEKRDVDSTRDAFNSGQDGVGFGVSRTNPLSATECLEDLPAGRVALELLAERFGIAPATFGGYAAFERSRGRLYLVGRDHRPPADPQPDGAGLLLMNFRIKYPKLTTAAALAFGRHATRNFLDLTGEQLQAYIDRRSFPVPAAQAVNCSGIGYVLVKYRGHLLGVALFIPDEAGAGGLIRSMFPKGWSPNKGGKREVD